MPKVAQLKGKWQAVAITTEAYVAIKEIANEINENNLRTANGFPAKVNIGGVATFAIEQFVLNYRKATRK